MRQELKMEENEQDTRRLQTAYGQDALWKFWNSDRKVASVKDKNQ
jgi:hypothetical protein